MLPIPQSLLFMKDSTLKGTKKEIYIILKILKYFTQKSTKSSVDRKVSSYVLKFAIDSVLMNRNPTREEMGASIRAVLHHPTLRGRFGSVSPALEEEGITRVEVGDTGLHFIRGDEAATETEEGNSRCLSIPQYVCNLSQVQGRGLRSCPGALHHGPAAQPPGCQAALTAVSGY
jgi:hypothetical protein